MTFKHSQFQLDQGSQIVFDASGKELKIFGNEYLMLEKLCQQKNCTHRELAVILGFGELYNGLQLDEYMKRLNAHLQDQVIEKNGDIFSILGEVSTVEKVEMSEASQDISHEIEPEKGENIFKWSWGTLLAAFFGLALGIWLVKKLMNFWQ